MWEAQRPIADARLLCVKGKRRNCAQLRKDTFAFCRDWDVPNKQFLQCG